VTDNVGYITAKPDANTFRNSNF